MTAGRRSLRARILAGFVLVGVGVATLFGGFSFLFAYVVEDAFFAHLLEEEVERQKAFWRADSTLGPPLREIVTLHDGPDSMPDDLRPAFAARGHGGEFAGGQGRHYHVRSFVLPDSARTVHLVAEVSPYLVVRPFRGEMLWLLGLAAGVMLLLVAGMGYAVGRRVTAPLARLSALVGGSDPAHLPRGFADGFPADEVGALARALDGAMARIAAFVERESSFTRDTSHELRTPLAVIRANADLLAARGTLPADAQVPLRRIADAALAMERTLDLLLALAREPDGAAGTLTLRPLALVEQAVIDAAPLLEARGMEVRVEVPPDWCVRSHPAALSLVLSNLIANAARHAGPGTLHILREGERLVLLDSGPGIPAELAGRLFQPGTRGPHSDGLGLGLSIVRRVAERYGLRLEIGPGPSAGTAARIGFPPPP